MPGNQIIWIINDAEHPQVIENEMDALETIGAGCNVLHYRRIQKAIDTLQENAEQKIPKIIFFDALKGDDEHGDREAGYKDFLYMVQKLKKSNIKLLPEYVVFMSANAKYADNCQELSDAHGIMPSGHIFATYRSSIYQASYILKKLEARIRTHEVDWELNAFFNRAFGIDLPGDEDAYDQFRIHNGLLRGEDAVEYWGVKKITGAQALNIINQDNKCRGKDSFLEYSINWHEASFSDAENFRNKPKINFDKAGGEDRHGYAAFSIEEIRELKLQSKPPVLFTERFKYEWFPQLDNLAGLVIANGDHTDHIKIVAAACHVSALIGVKNNYVIDPGTPEKKGGIAAEEIVITYGDRVTMNCKGKRLYADHLYLQPHIQYSHVRRIPAIYREAMNALNRPIMKFKANIDSLSQLEDAAQCEDGIGLVRTEHLAFADNEQRQALRQIFLSSGYEKMALNVFSSHQQKQATEIFEGAHYFNKYGKFENGYHVRIRLLDAPPEEFLEAEEVEALNTSIKPEDQRGVQMGLKKPNLYRRQLEAIFHAYADYLTMAQKENGPAVVNLEILVPMVRTLDELLTVKGMAAKAAEKAGVSQDSYTFGMMLETVEAAENINSLAPHVSFISFGTSDLTSVALRISRSNIRARKFCRKDPFLTLHYDVTKLIIQTVRGARNANPTIEIELCGAHAEDLESLKALRPARLNAVSVPPSDRNFEALRADWGLYDWRQYQKECSCA
ncbi:MAG: PEP-utilizing enzyme [Alphaproteobacteria bacterium]|nr:PEP-utilizing enzyme [Alphaproteobacteria bacterium]